MEHRLIVILTETYTPKDEEERLHYLDTIKKILTKAGNDTRWTIKQRLGKSVKIRLEIESGGLTPP